MADRITLTADESQADLPTAWEVGERLTGKKWPFLVEGQALFGEGLTDVLRSLGVGPKQVEIEGVAQPQDQPVLETLPRWHAGSIVHLSLTAQDLGREVHRLAREFRNTEEARVGLGQTPPEVYVLKITVRRLTRRQIPKKRAIYRERSTGRMVTRATWERSRRALQAAAKRSGRKAGPGRFVRSYVEG